MLHVGFVLIPAVYPKCCILIYTFYDLHMSQTDDTCKFTFPRLSSWGSNCSQEVKMLLAESP